LAPTFLTGSSGGSRKRALVSARVENAKKKDIIFRPLCPPNVPLGPQAPCFDVLAPFWLPFGSPWLPFGSLLAPFGPLFGCLVFLPPLRPTLHTDPDRLPEFAFEKRTASGHPVLPAQSSSRSVFHVLTMIKSDFINPMEFYLLLLLEPKTPDESSLNITPLPACAGSDRTSPSCPGRLKSAPAPSRGVPDAPLGDPRVHFGVILELFSAQCLHFSLKVGKCIIHGKNHTMARVGIP
jgi:hypothetical protein